MPSVSRCVRSLACRRRRWISCCFSPTTRTIKTARDIVEVRHIKANLVSMNVDKLVQEGYLERYAVASDRRKTKLLCTGKADPIIRKGRVVQNAFFKRLLDHVEPADQEVFFRTMELIGKNLDEIIKENA